MTLILDAGALVAIERGDLPVSRRLANSIAAGIPVTTHGGVIARVWRGGGGRQALLSRALDEVIVRALDGDLGRDAGLLLARTRTSDAIDAAVVAMAEDGDRILTSDADDITDLVAASGLEVHVIPV